MQLAPAATAAPTRQDDPAHAGQSPGAPACNSVSWFALPLIERDRIALAHLRELIDRDDINPRFSRNWEALIHAAGIVKSRVDEGDRLDRIFGKVGSGVAS